MKKNKCIIICGPTASGKTAVAIQVAQYFNTEIISADSRQCYNELNIGVAKPSALELDIVKHHFINSRSIYDNVTAADFEKYALKSAAEIFESNNTFVLCGGTGLYIKAFEDGLDDIAPVDENIKNEIKESYQSLGLEWLQHSVKNEDPLFWSNGEIQNPHRLLRALEVIRSTGTSIISLQTSTKKIRDFDVVKIGIEIPRNILYDRINKRVEEMRSAGLENEVHELLPFKHLKALQTVGYSELFDAFENETSLDQAFELIKQHTRHYAKRQMTWFKKSEHINWVSPENVLNFLKEKAV